MGEAPKAPPWRHEGSELRGCSFRGTSGGRWVGPPALVQRLHQAHSWLGGHRPWRRDESWCGVQHPGLHVGSNKEHGLMWNPPNLDPDEGVSVL